jgi:hypothetical protein
MAAPAWAEAQLALTGALRLARGDRAGMAYLNISIGGFWRSFHAAVLCYPLYLILIAFPAAGAHAVRPDNFDGLVVETIHYVVSWVAFPLLILPLTDWLGRSNRFVAFMVAYNWCQVPVTVLFTAVALAGGSGLLPVEAAALADLAAAVAALVYEWYIARVALGVTGLRALLVVAVDIVLATLLTQISTSLYSA